MASFRKFEEGKLGFAQQDELSLKPDDQVSYYNHLMGCRHNFGPAIHCSHGDANGTAYFMANVPEFGYEIKITGKFKDVQVVIKILEDALGATDLNPKLELPDNLKAPLERIKYMINWIKTGKI